MHKWSFKLRKKSNRNPLLRNNPLNKWNKCSPWLKIKLRKFDVARRVLMSVRGKKMWLHRVNLSHPKLRKRRYRLMRWRQTPRTRTKK